MPLTEPVEADVVIVGAGPAGLTLATLLRRYRPSTSVVVLEKQRFPRHKIGESMLVDVNRVLADMGALEQVEQAGFSRKYGATFIWGEARSAYTFLWRDGQVLVPSPDAYQLDYTWHVDRAEYDSILERCATQNGVRVLQEHTVTDVIQTEGRVTGLRFEDAAGDPGELHARWVVDCAGGHGPLTRKLAGKQLDEDLRNIAIFGYHTGVGWRDDLNGHPDLRRTLILTHPRGWIWMIPLKDGVTSVGFVTSVESYRAAEIKDHRAYYCQVLRELPEYAELFSEAQLFDYRGDGKIVHTVQEYSYSCDRIFGPGWVLCGDASGFVDAILSIGVFVAQNHAQFLACALATLLDAQPGSHIDEQLALDSYAVSARENLGAFRAVAHMFYAYNDSFSDWWRGCSEQLRTSTSVPLASDREAFLAFFTGFSARSALYDQALNALGGSFLLDVSHQLFGSEELFSDGQIGAEAKRARQLIASDPYLRLNGEHTLRPFALPQTSAGRLGLLVRLDIQLADDATGLAGSIARRLYLPDALAVVPALMDGTRTLTQIAQAMLDRGLMPELGSCRHEVMKLAYRFACMGVVEAVTTPARASL